MFRQERKIRKLSQKIYKCPLSTAVVPIRPIITSPQNVLNFLFREHSSLYLQVNKARMWFRNATSLLEMCLLRNLLIEKRRVSRIFQNHAVGVQLVDVFKCIQVRSGVFRWILWKFAVCFKIRDLSNPVNFDRRRVTGAFANRQQGDPTWSITFSHLRLFEDYTLSRWSDYSVTTSANRLLISPLLRSVCVPQVWSSRLAGGEGDNRIESTDRLVRTVKLESRRASNNWN